MWTKLSGITRLYRRECDNIDKIARLLNERIKGDAVST